MNKIFLIIPTLKQGGAERVMSELANEWAGKGHEVHLVLLVNCENFYRVDSRIVIHNLGFERKNAIFKIYSEIKTFLHLRKLLKQQRPDFVLSFMEKYNVLTIMAGRFLNLNIFVSDRSNPYKKIPASIAFLRSKTYKYATGIIAQTSLAKEVLEQSTKNKNIRVISNPVRKIEEFSSPGNEKVIINVGRCVPEKGQEYLIRAFAEIMSEDWKLVILGDGPLRNPLLDLSGELGLKEKLQMPGSVRNVDEWLSKAAIFAFPSISEGFPNALAEAMAAGLPCVSFDCNSGPKDIIKNGLNGYLIPVKDTDALSASLEKLMNDENLRIELGAEAKKIANELSLNKIADNYLKFCLNDIV